MARLLPALILLDGCVYISDVEDQMRRAWAAPHGGGDTDERGGPGGDDSAQERDTWDTLDTEDVGDTGETAETGEPGDTCDTADTAETGRTGETGDTVILDGDCDPGLPGVQPPTAWYADADGDGYGDPAVAVTECDPPSGTTADGTDCDDAHAEVHPGAAEVCGDGLDGDCDGTPGSCDPEGDVLLSGASATLLGEEAFDEAGLVLAPAGDVDGDGLPELLAGASRAQSGDSAGAVYLVSGPLSGSSSLALAIARIDGTSRNQEAGVAIAGPGDVDGDGTADLFVGSSDEAAWLLLGPVSGSLDVEAADASFLGSADRGGFGAALGGGDLDDDGLADLVVGAQDDGAGSVRVFYAPGSGELQDVDADATVEGEDDGDRLGTTAVSAGDVDGDGRNDLAIGACAESTGAVDAGAVYLFLDPPSGDQSAADADGRLFGATLKGHAGAALAGGRDADGDGLSDLVVGGGTRQAGSTAEVYLLVGVGAGDADLESAAAATLLGEMAGDLAGASVGLADADGDGLADVLVGAPGHGTTGAAYLVTSPAVGEVDLATAHARMLGESAGDSAGGAVAGLGDLGGDGFEEWAVGASASGSADRMAGAVYVWNFGW